MLLQAQGRLVAERLQPRQLPLQQAVCAVGVAADVVARVVDVQPGVVLRRGRGWVGSGRGGLGWGEGRGGLRSVSTVE